MVPVPLPISVNLGSHRAYVNHLRGLLIDCQAQIAMAPHDVLPFIEEAAEWLDLRFVGDAAAFDALPALAVELSAPAAQDLAYIQYTSGSTRFPRGVMIRQEAVLDNLVADGIFVRMPFVAPENRCIRVSCGTEADLDAFTAALAAAGQPPLPATLVGFLPPRKGPRRKRLIGLEEVPGSLVFFLSPHRLARELTDVAEIFGGDRPASNRARSPIKVNPTTCWRASS